MFSESSVYNDHCKWELLFLIQHCISHSKRPPLTLPGIRHFLPWHSQSTLIMSLDFIFWLTCSLYSDIFVWNLFMQFLPFHMIIPRKDLPLTFQFRCQKPSLIYIRRHCFHFLNLLRQPLKILNYNLPSVITVVCKL